jgi:hypothetical protein
MGCCHNTNSHAVFCHSHTFQVMSFIYPWCPFRRQICTKLNESQRCCVCAGGLGSHPWAHLVSSSPISETVLVKDVSESDIPAYQLFEHTLVQLALF